MIFKNLKLRRNQQTDGEGVEYLGLQNSSPILKGDHQNQLRVRTVGHQSWTNISPSILLHIPEEKPKEVEDQENKDGTFFKVLDRAEVEGRVLDLSFVQKIVVVLTSVSAEGGTNDTSKYTGDQGILMDLL